MNPTHTNWQPTVEVMSQVRSRTMQQKAAMWLAAVATFAAGYGTYRALNGAGEGASAPLSFRLQEMTPEDTGIRFVHEKGDFAPFFDNVRPFMQAVSAAACTTDVDHDGLLDVLMIGSGPKQASVLYKNMGGFKFAPVPVPILEHLNDDGFASDCTFADIDSDGYDDLIIGTVAHRPYVLQNVPGACAGVTGGSPMERSFIDVTDDAHIPDYMNGFAVNLADIDNDGDVDLLMADYFAAHYQESDIAGSPYVHNMRIPDAEGAGRMLPNNWGNATNGGQKHLLLNDGKGHFSEQNAEEWGLFETRFTFDIGSADINADGYVDFYFANDFGPDQLYLNKDGKKLIQVVGPLPTDVGRDPFKGMNSDLADMDHDGYPEIYVTNVFHPVLPEGNLLWSNRPHPSGDPFLRSFVNVAGPLGARDGGWGWGAKFVDVDLDSDTDIIATNGYISADPDKDYWYRMSRLVAGSGDVIADSRKWPPFEDRSMCGHQRSHVFLNDGKRFYERAMDAGVSRNFDGRGVLIADFDVDGRPDVMFITQGQPYFLGKNIFIPTSEQPDPPHFVGIRVRGDGKKVNSKAVGVRIVVKPSDPQDAHAFKPLYREISAGNSMSAQSMDWIVAGLGQYQKDVDVSILWTDGTRTEKTAIKIDQYIDVVYDEVK